MPNAKTHVPVGMVVGGAAAWAMCPAGQDRGDSIIEIAGGILGGNIGARMPDFIDPPSSPNHRGIGHGAFNAGSVGAEYCSRLSDWQNKLRGKAAKLEAQAHAEADSAQRSILISMAILCRLAAGILAGFLAGYASHLALDATTSRGLPLVCRQF